MERNYVTVTLCIFFICSKRRKLFCAIITMTINESWCGESAAEHAENGNGQCGKRKMRHKMQRRKIRKRKIFVPLFPFQHFPPPQFCAAFSAPAFSSCRSFLFPHFQSRRWCRCAGRLTSDEHREYREHFLGVGDCGHVAEADTRDDGEREIERRDVANQLSLVADAEYNWWR